MQHILQLRNALIHLLALALFTIQSFSEITLTSEGLSSPLLTLNTPVNRRGTTIKTFVYVLFYSNRTNRVKSQPQLATEHSPY